MGEKYPLSVKVDKGELVIRIGIKTLAFACERMDACNPYDEDLKDYKLLYRIVDPFAFAKDVKCELNKEEEDGSTPLTSLFDSVMLKAIENGNLGVEEAGEEFKEGGGAG